MVKPVKPISEAAWVSGLSGGKWESAMQRDTTAASFAARTQGKDSKVASKGAAHKELYRSRLAEAVGGPVAPIVAEDYAQGLANMAAERRYSQGTAIKAKNIGYGSVGRGTEYETKAKASASVWLSRLREALASGQTKRHAP